MRKYFILSMGLLFTPDVLFAASLSYYISGDNCFTNRDTFRYCGTPQTNKSGKKNQCNGITQNSGDSGYIHSYGETQNIGGTIYACCGDTGTAGGGRWLLKSTIDAKVKDKPKTGKNPVEGGTCSYDITYNACGEISNPGAKDACTTPDSCNDGLFMRNGACVAPCPSGQAFESTGSSTCIECPTTVKGGVHPNKTTDDGKQDPISGVCIKCHETAELFIYTTGECKKKTEITTQYTNAALALCWRCESNEEFKTCAGQLNGQQFDSSKLSNAPQSCQGK